MFLLALLLAVAVPHGRAQPSERPASERDSGWRPHAPFFIGMGAALIQPQGGLARQAGVLHAGMDVFAGLHFTPRLDVGLSIVGLMVDRQRDAVEVGGLDLDLETSTELVQVGLFGRYGPRLGGVRPYGEMMAGFNLFSTSTYVAGRPDPEGGAQHHHAAALAVGAGLGLEVHLEGPYTLHVRARHALGSTARYLVFEDEQAEHRRSGTSMTTLSALLAFDL